MVLRCYLVFICRILGNVPFHISQQCQAGVSFHLQLGVPVSKDSKGQEDTKQAPLCVLDDNEVLIKFVKKRIPACIQSNLQEITMMKLPSSQKSFASEKHIIHKESIKIFVSSWNVGGILPSDDFDIGEWLDTQSNQADIYVLGFQEIVPLNAGNILSPRNVKVSEKWDSLIGAALNRKLPLVTQEDKGEFQKVHPVRRQNKVKQCDISRDFQCYMSKQMVGLYVSVWIRSDLYSHIRHPSFSCVGCGIMGYFGNKGSVTLRFYLQETSFCFVCCHLASGGKEVHKMYRNADATEILCRTKFPCGPLDNLPRRILDHDQVIWLGDFNYRISLPDSITRSLVERKEWNILLEHDQLKVELTKGHVFHNWNEGAIKFSPTYKYYLNSDHYYGSQDKEKGDMRRSPAWCDRILWFGKGLKQNYYDRGELKLSDHRPVRAIFMAEIDVAEGSNCFNLACESNFHYLTSFET